MAPEDLEDTYVVGVDVGTGSVRAALVTAKGQVCKVNVQPVVTWTPQPEYFQQSSKDIWAAVCRAVKEVTNETSPEKVKGIGFDATCSLVVLDKTHSPVTVSPLGEDEQNIILWMDHRASPEASWINTLQVDVLKYVGGSISPEMQTPKLLWLKKNLPETWKRAAHFMDLPDFLTWQATGAHTRSLCTLVCKWTYCAGDEKEGWSEDYFNKLGLGDLAENNWGKIGNETLTPGTPVGNGLTVESAAELGLLPGTPVPTALIDAHAGGVGLLGCNAENISTDFKTRLALICGTSSCHMALTETPHFVKGVWGPYFSAMIPNMWLNEGGQTCTGHLVDHVIKTHYAYPKILKELPPKMHIQEYLNTVLESMAKKQGLPNIAYLTERLHMWPDFHGNRSPLADPSLLGMISGLNLAVDEENLALLYLASVQALAYGTCHIMNSLQSSGLTDIGSVLLCGGLSRNRVFVQVHADVLGLPVLCAQEPESVLLGSAMLAANAARLYNSVTDAIQAMGGLADVVIPDKMLKDSRFHEKKYAVFQSMVKDQIRYKEIMSAPLVMEP